MTPSDALFTSWMLDLTANEHSECLLQSMVKIIFYDPRAIFRLTGTDSVFEEALDHVILGMFTSYYLHPTKHDSDNIDRVRSTK